MIRSLLKKYHAESAILFGSYARLETNDVSDIDVVVFGGPGFDPMDVFSLAEDLHRLTMKAVDVYEIREIDQQYGLAQSGSDGGAVSTRKMFFSGTYVSVFQRVN